jgi:hypothetical protein
VSEILAKMRFRPVNVRVHRSDAGCSVTLDPPTETQRGAAAVRADLDDRSLSGTRAREPIEEDSLVREQVAVHLREDRKQHGAPGERGGDAGVGESAKGVLPASDGSNGHGARLTFAVAPPLERE